MLSNPEKTVRIGIDIMGSESSPELLLQAAHQIVHTLPQSTELIAIGQSSYQKLFPLAYQVASETIAMTDSPLEAIRRKKDSSISIGLELLKEGKIDAFVSAGNTGALVSGAKMKLSMLQGVVRPALLAQLPTKRTPLAVLDVGANVQCKASHLVQFAQMGAAYQLARSPELPVIGLLNIGTEAMKGTAELRHAYQELRSLAEQPDAFFRFAGNIEGKAVFEGHVDVLVTDGFSGNVFLKTAEGLANLILDRINENASKEIIQSLRKELHDLERHLHYAEYPGALLCGVKGVVIKCHGYSSPEAFTSGIREAERLVRENFLDILRSKRFMKAAKTTHTSQNERKDYA